MNNPFGESKIDRTPIDPYQEPPNRYPAPNVLIERLRQVIKEWRENGYPGVTPTTRRLLEFWFLEDHENGFRFYFAQREAAETVIYIHEVLKARKLQELVNKLGVPHPVNPDRDLYPRWAIKMATGSGKTVVMAMMTAWSILNARRHPETNLSSHVLIVAPNIIVMERLWRDFRDNSIFYEMPILPPEFRRSWDVAVTKQDEPLPDAGPTITVTNIQRLYPPRKREKFKSPIDALLGEKPTKNVLEKDTSLFERFLQFERILVINDEAHHVHGGFGLRQNREDIVDLSEEEIDRALKGQLRRNVIVWLKTLLDLNGGPEGSRLAMQLDFSATPKSTRGQLFQHTVVDFPLRDAMRARIVKWPIKIKIDNAREYDSENPVVRFRDYLEAGIRRLKDYEAQHLPAGKQPVLFVMAEDTVKANAIADFLKEQLGEDKVLVIHTRDTGQLPSDAKSLEDLRRLAHSIDERKDFRAIVSVLMLREGWDVKNVCVILGLRAYSAPAQILPEQTIGRGLRRMYPRNIVQEETLDVLGTAGFMRFVEQLHAEDVVLEEITEEEARRRMGKTIVVDPERAGEFDIAIPILQDVIETKVDSLKGLAELLEPPDKPFRVPESIDAEVLRRTMRGFYVGTDEKAFEEDFYVSSLGTLTAIVYYFASELAREFHIGGAVPVIADEIERYIREKVFPDWPSDPNDEIRYLWCCLQPDFKEFLFKEARDKMGQVLHEERPFGKLVTYRRLSQMEGFIHHGDVYYSKKCVLPLVPYDSLFEKDFMAFLDGAEDVVRWGKLVGYIFYLRYVNGNGHIRHYIPDFVVETQSGHKFLVETKGLLTPEVSRKRRRAEQWAKALRDLGLEWWYLEVSQEIWGRHVFNSFEELVRSVIVDWDLN